jgi:hypothetical protein
MVISSDRDPVVIELHRRNGWWDAPVGKVSGKSQLEDLPPVSPTTDICKGC